MKNNQFDICIIGAGSGGLSVAAGAAQLGLKTALIEKSKMGGDCLNTGCVPSKALLHAAKIAQTFRDAGKVGIKPQEPEIDFSGVKDGVFDVIAAIEPNDSVERFEGFGVKVIKGAAKFSDHKSVKVGEKTIHAKYFIVASGSRASVPPITGLDASKAYTNENIFELREKPEHLIIIGGGPIGMEMSQAHRRLGCRVSVLSNSPIAPKDDPELVEFLRSKITSEGVELYENIEIKSVAHLDGGVSATISQDGKEKIIKGSHVLVAAGRKANVDGLDLEKAGVAYTPRGINVDARLRTSRKNIFAIGDVSGAPQFTHIAGYHAGIIIRNICFKIPARVDYTALPWVTYCDPEIANAGLTYDMAINKYGKDNVKIVKWSFEENDRAQANRRTDGLIKIVLDKKGKILGAGVVGENAGEIISLWALAITKRMKIGDITAMIAPYPTLGEVSKRVAGAWFTPSLFSDKTKRIVRLLQKLPF